MKPTLVRKTRLNKWIWRNFPHCAEAVKLITARMDGRLPLLESIKLKVHMFSCPPCVNFFNHLKLLRTALRTEKANFTSEDSSTGLTGDAQARIKKALENAVSQNEI